MAQTAHCVTRREWARKRDIQRTCQQEQTGKGRQNNRAPNNRDASEVTPVQEIKLWEIKTDDHGTPLVEPPKGTGQMETEGELEEMLVWSPGLFIEDLRLVGRQTETPGGPNAFVQPMEVREDLNPYGGNT
jgi:hypothetical protein